MTRETLAQWKERCLRACDSADHNHGADAAIPFMREAVLALPDRALLAKLPTEIQAWFEDELSRLEMPS